MSTSEVAGREWTRTHRVLAMGSLVFAAVVAGFYLSSSVLDPDEAIVAAIARRMIDFDLPVYEAGWDPKPPILFWIYRGLFALFGTYNLFAVHVASAIAWVVTAGIVGYGSARLLGPSAFAPSVVAYTLLRSIGKAFAGAANFEAFMNPFLAASLLLLLLPDRTWRSLFAGGFLLAVAAALKPPVILYCLAVLLTVGLVYGRAALLRTAWAAGAGGVAGFALLGTVLWLTGDLSAAWALNVDVPQIYIAHGRITDFGERLAKLASLVIDEPAPWLFVATGVGTALFAPRALSADPRVRRWGIAGAVFLLIGLYLQTQGGYFFRHYMWMLHPAMGVAAAAGWCALVHGPDRRIARVLGRAAAAALVLLVWVPAHRVDKRRLLNELERDRFGIGGTRELADAVRELTEPTDPIFVWGWTPHLYVSADRVAATRFTQCDFLSGSVLHEIRIQEWPPDPEVIPGAWEACFDDLNTYAPRLIVDTAPAAHRGWTQFPVSAFPEFEAFLQERYRRVLDVDGCHLYLRSSP